MGYLRDKIILIIAKETIVIVLINMSRRYPVQLSLVLLAGGFMKLIAIYCRTSTLIQKSGLDSQKRSLIEYCKQNNIDNYVIYEDKRR